MRSDPAVAAATAAVRLAAVVTRQVQPRLADETTADKADGSPVTVADYAAQAVILLTLRRALGDVPVVGEERADALRDPSASTLRRAVVEAAQCVIPDATESDVLEAIDAAAHDGSADQFWTVDPIDGTRGYVDQAQYSLALARVERARGHFRGRATLGVLGCPNMGPAAPPDVIDRAGSLLVAVEAGGAWAIGWTDDGSGATRVRCRAEPADPPEMVGSVDRNRDKDVRAAAVLDRLPGGYVLRQLDSQCKYAAVAMGLADGYVRVPRQPDFDEKIWDHAAGDVIAREAGAAVTDLLGRSLDYSHGDELSANAGVICASPSCHEQLIEAVRQCPAYQNLDVTR